MYREKIINFIRKKTKKKIHDKTDLIREKIIDSFGIIELVEFIEEKLKLKCPISSISTHNFNNIDLIMKYLKKKNKKII